MDDHGEIYPVRLSPELGRGGALAGAFIFMGIVTATAIGIVYWMLHSGQLGLWFFAALAIAADVALARLLFNAMRGMHVPDPIVEIDHDPVRRGEQVMISIRQPGPARFERYEASLSCELNHGGDIRHRNKHMLFKEAAIVVDDYSPLARTATAAIASDAPPSLKTVKNLTTWKITIKRGKTQIAALDREFVFRVVE
jgi:hypothetical protein